MAFLSIPAGQNCPDDINVIIEIPLRGDPVKYEVDKESGALHVDRFLGTSMQYPINYGYIPQTLSEDGDPVDVLVMAPLPLMSGSVIRCRPVGLLAMEDESGVDAKILAVPVDKLTPLYKDIHAPSDFPACTLNMISHFFEHYKDLEAGKWVKLQGWKEKEAARAEILASIERYKKSI